jgi:hypothetical protein
VPKDIIVIKNCYTPINYEIRLFSCLLSQIHELDQSMASSVISAVIGHLTQSQGESCSSGNFFDLRSGRCIHGN